MSTSEPVLLRPAEILIDGAWVPGRTDRRRQVVNPASLAPICETAACGLDDIAAATQAARRALPGWQGQGAAERAELIDRIGAELVRHARELAIVHARETGQVYWESLDAVHAAAGFFGAAGLSQRGGAAAALERDGIAAPGVVAFVSGSDAPLVDWGRVVAGALARGSTLVCLPPPDAPLTILAASSLLCALPPGVINVVTADDDGVRGRAAFEGIDAVVSGDVPTRECILVGGGADLELAVAGSASLRLYHSGQRRGQSPRIYIEQGIADAFTERLHEFMALLEVGDPTRPATDLGPLATPLAMRQAEEAFGRALRQGGRLRLGGRRYQPWGLKGYFLQPTLLVDRGDAAGTDAEHIGGPVVIVTPVPDITAAIRRVYRGGECLRASLFAPDDATLARSLGDAGIPVRTREASGTCEWIGERLQHRGAGSGEVLIEHVRTPRPDWFPYARRPLAASTHAGGP